MVSDFIGIDAARARSIKIPTKHRIHTYAVLLGIECDAKATAQFLQGKDTLSEEIFQLKKFGFFEHRHALSAAPAPDCFHFPSSAAAIV